MDIFGNFENKKSRKTTPFNYKEYQYQDATLAGMSDLPDEKPRHSFFIYYFGLFVLMFVLVFRLFDVQVVSSTINQRLGEGNRIRPRIIPAPRGIITDNAGNWLARNMPSFALTILPADLPRVQSDRDNIYQKLVEISGLSVDEIKKIVEKGGLLSLDPVVLKQNVSREEALILEQKIADLAGVQVLKKAIREYNSQVSFGSILGYLGKVDEADLERNTNLRLNDEIGKNGIEKIYDTYLRGRVGIENVEVDSKGRIARVLADKNNFDPQAGNNLVLSLNTDFQKKVFEYLQAGIVQANVKSGAAIAMDPKTGAILSMVTIPSFDNNLFARGISNEDYKTLIENPDNPLFNRATNGTYPPGSVIKPFIASAALQEGTINENTAFDTPAAIEIGEYIFPDWKDHGYTDVRRAIAESNNIFFYSLGGGYDQIKGLGPDRLKKYLSLFGFGSDTGIDLSSEASGSIPDPEWKQKVKNEPWYLGDTYHMSIGQGDVLVTPLQMVTALSAIANGGKLLSPQLVKEIRASDGTLISGLSPKEIRNNFISPKNIQLVQQGMRLAVTEGSARKLGELPITSAGKTGTAQFLDNQKTHAWFECYAPYEDPQIAVVVLVDGGGAGNEIAVPIAENILKAYFGLQ